MLKDNYHVLSLSYVEVKTGWKHNSDSQESGRVAGKDVQEVGAKGEG